MTERFELAYENGDWWAVRDGDLTLWKEEVVQELNNLDKENKKLLIENGQLCSKIDILEHQNRELRGKASSWKITASKEMLEKSKLAKKLIDNGLM